MASAQESWLKTGTQGLECPAPRSRRRRRQPRDISSSCPFWGRQISTCGTSSSQCLPEELETLAEAPSKASAREAGRQPPARAAGSKCWLIGAEWPRDVRR